MVIFFKNAEVNDYKDKKKISVYLFGLKWVAT